MSDPVRIPTDLDQDDRIVAGLTTRQVAVLATVAALLYGAWLLARPWLPWPVFAAVTVPVVIAVFVVVTVRREGRTLDRHIIAAIRHHRAPTRLLPPPTIVSHHRDGAGRIGGLHLPPRHVRDDGIIDLGPDGMAVIAAASPVNLALRTPAEQDALVGGFARWLHSLTEPVQILIHTQPADLTDRINVLRHRAESLPHPALAAAAHEHADHLTDLAATLDLLHRQVLVIVRDPTPTDPVTDTGPGELDATRHRRRTALVRRLDHAAALLAPAGITLTALDRDATSAVLGATCRPDTTTPDGQHPGLADVGDVITHSRTHTDIDSPGS